MSLGDQITGSPVIGVDGTIYIGHHNGKLYAFNPDGSEKWSFQTGRDIFSTPVITSDGTIYVGSGDGKLYAVRPDGTQKWAFDTGGSIQTSPNIGYDGTVYVPVYDVNKDVNKFFAITPSGELKWTFSPPWGNFDPQSSPAIAPDGTIYTRADSLYAINPDGTVKWTHGPGARSPTIASDGTIIGDVTINPDGTRKVGFPGSPAVAIAPDGTILVGIGDYLNAYNTDGSDKWSFPIGDGLSSKPSVAADGTVYFGTTNVGRLLAVNSDGTLKWSILLNTDVANTGIRSSVAISADGTLYVASYDGKLHAIGAAQ